MKTLIAILTAASVLGLGAQRASAHDGWSTTGKILTGLVIGGAVARAFEPPPTVVYTAPPVVYTPAPAVTYTPAPAPVAYTPAPVVTYAAPVVAPAPVVVYTAPVYRPYYYYPGPVVSFRFGFGGGHYHRRW